MRKLEQEHQQRYEDVTADAGYESQDNYLYLEANGQTSFIKSQFLRPTAKGRMAFSARLFEDGTSPLTEAWIVDKM